MNIKKEKKYAYIIKKANLKKYQVAVGIQEYVNCGKTEL